jgi:hypothetical protein
MKMSPSESLLSVPIETLLLSEVKAEAKQNGMYLREAVEQAMREWLATTADRRVNTLSRDEVRRRRLEQIQ